MPSPNHLSQVLGEETYRGLVDSAMGLGTAAAGIVTTLSAMRAVVRESQGGDSPNLDPASKETLADTHDRAQEVYGKVGIDPPDIEELHEAWISNPELAAYAKALDEAGMAYDVVLSATNLSIAQWQEIYKTITHEQPEGAPNSLAGSKERDDGVGLYFEHNDNAKQIYNQNNNPTGTDIQWELTVIITGGRTKGSGVIVNTSHDLSKRGKDLNIQAEIVKEVTNHPDITPKANYPTVGAKLTQYASHIIRQEKFPEGIWTWCKETGGSFALVVGFYLGGRRVRVHWCDVSSSAGYLGVASSVRGKLGV